MTYRTAREFVAHDEAISNQIAKLRRFPSVSEFKSKHPFATSEFYIEYHAAYNEHRTLVGPQIEALEAHRLPVLTALRTLPETEARLLFVALSHKEKEASWPDMETEPHETR